MEAQIPPFFGLIWAFWGVSVSVSGSDSVGFRSQLGPPAFCHIKFLEITEEGICSCSNIWGSGRVKLKEWMVW